VTPRCGFQNPEDLVALPAGSGLGAWLLVSQMASNPRGAQGDGSLLAYRPEDGVRRPLFPAASAAPFRPGLGAAGCPGPPDGGFGPHGIDLARSPGGALRLLVVNHAGREAVELFDVARSPAGPSLTWRGCVPLPEDVSANDVAALPDGGMVVTKFLPREQGVGSLLRLALGWNTGRVLEWHPGQGWRAVPGSEESAPNGIAVSPDGGTLFIASWGRKRLVRLARDGSGRRELELSFHPDNLSWTPDGKLLVAGQKGSLLKIPSCAQRESGTCGIAWAVLRVDPADLRVEERVERDPARVTGAVSVALLRGGRLWLGSFASDRLAFLAP